VPTRNDLTLIEENGWIVRVKAPEQITDCPKAMLLIHGLGGNENVMWIFAKNIPPYYWIFSPRGAIAAEDGYAWVPPSTELPVLLDFAAQAASLMAGYRQWAQKTGAPQDSFDVMGFSQGAAMSYALATFYPHAVKRLIALAGYLPREDAFPGRYSVLGGKAIFIAHGSKDTVIPLAMAEEAVQTLQALGARVSYCRSETGHKMNSSCLKGLEEFLNRD